MALPPRPDPLPPSPSSRLFASPAPSPAAPGHAPDHPPRLSYAHTLPRGRRRFTRAPPSTLSDTVSDAASSIRSSTDDLLLPSAPSGLAIVGRRVGDGGKGHTPQSTAGSHWQSAPLALALVPAAAGIVFADGTAVATDATILLLAAVFLNWSVRLPWKWYESARLVAVDADAVPPSPSTTATAAAEPLPTRAARRRLRFHQLLALLACFALPATGAWLLHSLRGQLLSLSPSSSSGLVSNYNLTIFLLAAEIRPAAHLLRLLQARTLYLQRVAWGEHSLARALGAEDADLKLEATRPNKELGYSSGQGDTDAEGETAAVREVRDLAKRLGELERHVADAAERAHEGERGRSRSRSKEGEKERSRSQSPRPDHDNQPRPTQHGHNLQPLQPSHFTQDRSYGRNTNNDNAAAIAAIARSLRRMDGRIVAYALDADARLRRLEARMREMVAVVGNLVEAEPQGRSYRSKYGNGYRYGNRNENNGIDAAAQGRSHSYPYLSPEHGHSHGFGSLLLLLFLVPARILIHLLLMPVRVVLTLMRGVVRLMVSVSMAAVAASGAIPVAVASVNSAGSADPTGSGPTTGAPVGNGVAKGTTVTSATEVPEVVGVADVPFAGLVQRQWPAKKERGKEN